MALNEVDEIDLLIGENITFLNNCFDSTFVLQNSLPCVKEYVAEAPCEHRFTKPKTFKEANRSLKSCKLDLSLHQSRISTQHKETSRFLKNWGLPEEITRKYEEKGITKMFEWQVSCLGNSKVLTENSNLIYSAPTSAGKTLVAEILTIKTILERKKKVIIILPFISIVREKMFYLQEILSSSGIRVEGFMGSQSPPGGLQATHVAICTIEKANSLLNRLIDDNNISELGAIIVDELHLLGDPHRGYILELLLTKVKYISKRLDLQIQIVGMSATLPNLEELAKWLDAELFVTDFRPIPLEEFCLIGNKFYKKHGKYECNINSIESSCDNDNILNICLETIRDGCSILIFCMTKNRCENLAQNIATSFFKLGCKSDRSGLILRKELNSEKILETLEQLKNCPVGLDQVLKQVISFGVAYHHAGLTFDERDIIEGSFKSGALRVLVATSTLSSGVNLPARRVIIRSPIFQRQPINILTYKQMVGRAGRMGKDIKGESILICTEAERKVGFELMSGTLDSVKSCIDSEDKYMRSMLEIIASEDVVTRTELELYSKCTLLYTQKLISDNSLLEGTLKELINYELIRTQADSKNESYVATALGKACLSSSMAPNDGLSLFCELQKARQCLVLETELHLIYLVTPYSVSNQWSDIDWLHLLTLWESLTKAMKRVGELVGVQESFIIRSLRGTRNTCLKKLNIHKRFYTALALQDLVNEMPLSEVATKFQCARGFLQGLQQAAATFAGMVTAFCRQLGWKNVEMLISQFQDRLHFGIHSELIELVKLPSLNSTRARALFDAGLENVSDIASADINVIENIFHKAVPFQSEKKRDDDDDLDIRKRNNIKNIWITGCCGMTPREAANVLILEARKYLKLEIGVEEIKWNCNNNSNTTLHVKSQNDQLKEETICKDDVLKNIEDNIKECNGSNENRKENEIYTFSVSVNGLKDKNKISKGQCDIKTKVTLDEILNKASCSTYINLNNVDSLNRDETMKGDSKILQNNAAIGDKKISVDEIVRENNINSLCTSTKDEILWESLSFTETALQNISQTRSSGTLFKPDVSFSPKINLNSIESKPDTPKSIPKNISKSSSSKDISLFSSDTENSFLDESLSNITDIQIPCDKNKSRVVNSSDYIINSNTLILTAFKSSFFENGEDEDIKLIYEDEENDLFEDSATSSIDNNEVVSTQESEKLTVKFNFISPLKRRADLSNKALCQSSVKKKQKVDEINFSTKWISTLTLSCKESNQIVLKFNDHIINCFLLRGSDILYIVEIIENSNLASIIVEMETRSPVRDNLIGIKVIKNFRAVKNISKETYTKDLTMKAIAICVNEKLSFYLDLTSSAETLLMIKSIISKWLDKTSLTLKMLCLKSTYLNIKYYFKKEISARCSDIALTEWLLDSDTRLKKLSDLVSKYFKTDMFNIELKINSNRRSYKDLEPAENMCLRAWFTLMVAEQQELSLLQQYNSKTMSNELEDIETHVLKILARSESHGITVDKQLVSQLLIDVKKSQEVLQTKAFKMCGYTFNFNSPKCVAKVLGMYKGRKVSTKKSVLSAHSSPLASMVLFWRKLNTILTKTLCPITEKACHYSADDKLSPSYTMYTCTGRISMHEPNLQNVPRTFTVPVRYLSQDDSDDVMEFNCRSVFKAGPGAVFVSADYCQLEMRIMTHYSGDAVLGRIMSSGVDVFKAIATAWSGVPEGEVDDDLRQKAKQLCYGIIYGMGNRTLSQHLDVTEVEAAMFMDTFYKTYPAIRVFTQKVLEDCKKTGYVETLKKRRRYLPDINSPCAAKRSAAEWQAVNTMIQGSAADIAKAAMCAIDRVTGAALALQMHDELIYEVPEAKKHSFIATIKQVMEGTIRLDVPLPVKVKCGYTWGSLQEVNM